MRRLLIFSFILLNLCESAEVFSTVENVRSRTSTCNFSILHTSCSSSFDQSWSGCKNTVMHKAWQKIRCAKCGAHGSPEEGRSLIRFPRTVKDLNRLRKWAEWLHPEETWNDDSLLAISKRGPQVCNSHFTPHDFTPSGSLSRYAVPRDSGPPCHIANVCVTSQVPVRDPLRAIFPDNAHVTTEVSFREPSATIFSDLENVPISPSNKSSRVNKRPAPAPAPHPVIPDPELNPPSPKSSRSLPSCSIMKTVPHPVIPDPEFNQPTPKSSHSLPLHSIMKKVPDPVIPNPELQQPTPKSSRSLPFHSIMKTSRTIVPSNSVVTPPNTENSPISLVNTSCVSKRPASDPLPDPGILDPELNPPTPKSSRTISFQNTETPRTTLTPDSFSTPPNNKVELSSESTGQKSARRNILGMAEVTRKKHLTPRKERFYSCIQRQRKEIKRLRTHCKKLKGETLLKTISSSTDFDSLCKSMTPAAATLVAAQLRLGKKKPKARRWKLDEKLLALTIQRKSPACYRLMRKMMALPSKTTLDEVLNSFPLTTGVSDKVLSVMSESVKKMPKGNEVCTLSFDEMSIMKHFRYNSRTDQMEGYEDHGDEIEKSRKNVAARHALVFMLCGLKSKWKQPIALYFSGNQTSATRLRILVTHALLRIFEKGFRVVATVCDMGGSNVAGLNKLKAGDIKRCYFMFDQYKIATVYDPPHLLKCTRNMYKAHDVVVTINPELIDKKKKREESSVKEGDNTGTLKESDKQDDGNVNGADQAGKGKEVDKPDKSKEVDKPGEVEGGKVKEEVRGVAKWSDIELMYAKEREKTTTRSLTKFKDNYLNPKFGAAMKVKIAAQTMSHTAGSTLLMYTSKGEMDALASASFTMEVDNLFDSLNGRTAQPENGKFLKMRLSDKSKHLDFWKEQKRNVARWEFKGCNPPPPSQEGWIITMNATELVWKQVREKGFSFLEPRSLNQDPLECLFGIARGLCGQNKNPTEGQMIAALKTIVINRLAYNDIKNMNCEAENYVFLADLRSLLELPPSKSKVVEGQQNDVVATQEEAITEAEISTLSNDIRRKVAAKDQELRGNVRAGTVDILSMSYVSGRVAGLMLMKRNCSNCRSVMLGDAQEPHNMFIDFKEYSSDIFEYEARKLVYPSVRMVEAVGKCATRVEQFLDKEGHVKNLKKSILACLKEDVDLSWLFTACPLHKDVNANGLFNTVFHIWTGWWCTKKNRKYLKQAIAAKDKRKLEIVQNQ